MSKYCIIALYKFTMLENFKAMQAPLLKKMNKYEVKGTLLLSYEGLNGTIAGTKEGVHKVLSHLNLNARLANLSYKTSYHNRIPFNRAKVKLKKEIVTLGIDGLDLTKLCGTYVKPKDWNDLISDPEVLLIDTRNNYEIEIGNFKNSVNPNTENFREFPQYVAQNLDKNKHKKVAMCCTGGIRCEKSTAYLKMQGFEHVYHLEGGILKYLEEIKEKNSLWQGECFVFDSRVTVNHRLEKGQYDQCYACRHTITESDKKNPKYQAGISCHHCNGTHTKKQQQRFSEREKQKVLATMRDEEHIGSDVRNISQLRKMKKIEKLAHNEI